MTKTPSHTRCWADFVLNFDHSDFDIVSANLIKWADFNIRVFIKIVSCV
jgi:hypothetical protein